MMKVRYYYLLIFFVLILSVSVIAQTESKKELIRYTSFHPLQTWLDNRGEKINAHGGGVLYSEGKYYWFGEHRPVRGYSTEVGIACYSSTDLYNWRYESVALQVSSDEKSEIAAGCIMERPKVIYNKSTKKFVLWFHLELKGRGYEAARAAVAQSDRVEGPYKYIGSFRLNSGQYPLNMPDSERTIKFSADDYDTQINPWWTPSWRRKIKQGLLFQKDFEGGQMSRDQTLFLDDNGKAYQITSSEENLTLMISELTPDYLSYTGRFVRVAPGGQNEAPTMFKHKGTYWMITSGCTGWDPNAARLFSSSSVLGTWTEHGNPCVGENASNTFGGQATYVLKVHGKRSHFIFMADQWRPYSLADSRYIWLPIRFSKEDGRPYLEYKENWNLHDF